VDFGHDADALSTDVLYKKLKVNNTEFFRSLFVMFCTMNLNRDTGRYWYLLVLGKKITKNLPVIFQFNEPLDMNRNLSNLTLKKQIYPYLTCIKVSVAE
jgi:hypothetical protein